jgi:type I restriction enzyme S subunit
MTISYWIEKELGDILALNYGWSLPEKKRVTGDVPVYGSNGVVGSHNEALVNSAGLIVGRKGSAGNVHYSRKPFCPIDTTFFIAPGDTKLDLEFLFYLLLHADLKRILGDVGVPGLNREVAYKEKVRFPSKKEEQRKIAGVLGVVQRAMEQQERLLALTAELKKALLHKLFAEGLRGEPQKQTEIGPVPESWDLVPCQDLCEMITVGVVVKPASHYVQKGVPAFRSFNVQEDRLATNDLVYFSETANDTTLAKSRLRAGDVLVVRTGYPGTSCVVPKEFDGANCIDLVIVRPKAGVIRSGFLSRYFNAPAGKSQAVAAKHGLAQQHLNVSAVKRTLVPVPSLEEQDEIDSALATVQRKIALITAKKEILTALFRTLLHQLMTAQIRVPDLDKLECILERGDVSPLSEGATRRADQSADSSAHSEKQNGDTSPHVTIHKVK